jgi:TolB-like protein/Tfp pilus assembly protein PilF
VFRVGVAYVAVAWLLIQLVNNLAEMLSTPPWVGRATLILVIAGWPVALILAWFLEPSTASDIPHAPTALRRRLNFTIVAALACAVVVLLADKYLSHGTPYQAGAATAATAPSSAARQPDVLANSVAVLPCANQSPKAEDAYFAAGIHEEIILRLAKLSNLRPIPRLAMLPYANSTLAPAQIAAEVRAHDIVDCTVRYANDRVRITAELIDPSSMRVLWSDAYEQEWDRVFAIQADIAMKIANAIGAEFSPTEQAQIERPPTKSAEAYRLYLQARDLVAVSSPESIRQGLLLLDRALELDPEFAEGRAAKLRARVDLLIDVTAGAAELTPPEVVPQLRAELERTVQLDPTVAESHLALGVLAEYTWRWREAIEHFRVCASLSPGRVDAEYALLTGYMGITDEGIRYAEQGLRSEPVNANVMLGVLYAYRRDYDKAAAYMEAAQRLAPTSPLISNWVGNVAIARGDEAEAVRRFRFTEQALGADVRVFSVELAYAYHRLGRNADAARFVEQLRQSSDRRPLSAGASAMVSLASGDDSAAIKWLEVAAEKASRHEVEAGYINLLNLKMNFTNDPLLKEPQFAQVLSRIKGD